MPGILDAIGVLLFGGKNPLQQWRDVYAAVLNVTDGVQQMARRTVFDQIAIRSAHSTITTILSSRLIVSTTSFEGLLAAHSLRITSRPC